MIQEFVAPKKRPTSNVSNDFTDITVVHGFCGTTNSCPTLTACNSILRLYSIQFISNYPVLVCVALAVKNNDYFSLLFDIHDMMNVIKFLLLFENKIINNIKVLKIVTHLNGKVFEKIKNRDLEIIIRSVAVQIKMHPDSDMIEIYNHGKHREKKITVMIKLFSNNIMAMARMS